MEAGEPRSAPHRREVVLLHSPSYLEALGRLPVHQQRERRTLALLEACFPDGELSQHVQLVAPTVATREQLEAFHSRDYIDILYEFGAESESLSAVQEQGEMQLLEEFGLVDDAYVFPGLFGYCSYVAGATLTAVDALLHLMKSRLRDEVLLLLPPVAINLGGGRHHAMRSHASGFCYVNDAVLGIQRLVSKGRVKRVLVVDIDVHHGDGTQEAFYYSEKVTTISFHLREPAFFPGTGADSEVGAGRGKHNNVNVPLQRGITDGQFHALFQRVVDKAVGAVEPEMVVLVCGVDTLARDPLGGFNLTSGGICDCVETVMALQLPVLLLGAGGYSGADASKSFTAVVATVIGQRRNLPDQIPEHAYYEEYLPNVQLATTAAAHRPNLNMGETLLETGDRAIATLEQAASIRQSRTQQISKKRARDSTSGLSVADAQIGFVRISSELVEDAAIPTG
ncbi:Histone deacetylase 8 [Phytophthora pseudosyringae]|uniref:Histone deacetylase n=1 Tax=Phytophthora pseudosyringae TaxID=221518 RepID=A0A8T1WI21_9STRA|nr:Histone deacetylase 8 [Phytophthora pseudosyringae]